MALSNRAHTYKQNFHTYCTISEIYLKFFLASFNGFSKYLVSNVIRSEYPIDSKTLKKALKSTKPSPSNTLSPASFLSFICTCIILFDSMRTSSIGLFEQCHRFPLSRQMPIKSELTNRQTSLDNN